MIYIRRYKINVAFFLLQINVNRQDNPGVFGDCFMFAELL